MKDYQLPLFVVTTGNQNKMGLNNKAILFFDDLGKKIKNPLETKNLLPDTSDIDCKFILENKNGSNKILDLGSGTGLVINKLIGHFSKIIVVEINDEFSKFIIKDKSIEIIKSNLLIFHSTQRFPLITMFAVSNYFDKNEVKRVYKNIHEMLESKGRFILKAQYAYLEDVRIDYSKDLGSAYFSEYRLIGKELNLLASLGFKLVSVTDIYPPEYNIHNNTHFFAIIVTKD